MSEGVDRGTRRAALRRGGERTPILKTVVRTDAVVANSRGLQLSAELSVALLEAVAEEMPDEPRQRAVRAVAEARQQVAEAYGDGDHYIDTDACEAEMDQSKQRHRTAMHKVPPTWPTCGVHDPVAAFVSSAARLAALSTCFATSHRKQDYVENDVTEAIGNAQFQLDEAYVALDDEVFAVDPDAAAMATARIVHRRSREIASLAANDRRGEVFGGEVFAAVRGAFVDAAKHFNTLYLGLPLLDTKMDVEWEAPIVATECTAEQASATIERVASEVRTSSDPRLVRPAVEAAFSRVVQLRTAAATIKCGYCVPEHDDDDELFGDIREAVLAETHARMADAIHIEGLRNGVLGVTNHRVRTRRHLDRALRPAGPGTPIALLMGGGDTDLRLSDWVAHAEQTDEAEFAVVGGFSVGLDGGFHFSAPADAGGAEWLTLRAWTAATATEGPERNTELARSSATSAWRCMSYDAGTYDAPYFRPSADHLEAASRVGVALCGRGNTESRSAYADADVLHVDVGMATASAGLVRRGDRVLLTKASTVLGFMFSPDEIATAAIPLAGGADNADFLGTCERAPAHPSLASADSNSAEPTGAPTGAPPQEEDLERLLSIPVAEAYQRTLHHVPQAECARPWPEHVEASVERPDADRAADALQSAVGAAIATSPLAMDTLVRRITDTSHMWHTVRLPGASAVTYARQAEYVSPEPAKKLYACIGGQSARHIDVAASRLGLLEVANVLLDEDDVGALADADEQRSDTSRASSKAIREATIDSMAFDEASAVAASASVYFGLAPGALDLVAGAGLVTATTRRLSVSGAAFTGWRFEQ